MSPDFRTGKDLEGEWVRTALRNASACPPSSRARACFHVLPLRRSAVRLAVHLVTIPLRDTIDKKVFLRTLPCLTRGWFDHRAQGVALTPADEWGFYCGNQVGDAARQYLGAGLMLPRTPATAALEATDRMLAIPATQLLFEASFRWGAFSARADALRRGRAGWELIEVKSSAEPKEGKGVDRELVDDLAYTVMVARGAGLAVERCVLVLLSRSYRRGSSMPLFVELDVTAAVEERAREFAATAPQVAAAVHAETPSEPVLKVPCRQCDYFASECLGHGVEDSIFVLPGLSEKRLQQMVPIVDLHQLPDDVDLTDRQRRVFDVMRSGKPLVMSGLERLDDVAWPVHYLDFETVAPFLPWFDGDGVHAVHPFQYSIHRREDPHAALTHREYLAPLDGDWRRELAERLLNDLGDRGSVLVYTDFEERRLRELAADCPDLAGQIDSVISRLFDLHEVVKDGYCHPGFGGGRASRASTRRSSAAGATRR